MLLAIRPAHYLITVLLIYFISSGHGAPTSTEPAAWTTCPASISENLQCIDVEVPLSYDDPSGESISLTVVKLPAKNAADRKGSLVWQLGGPGIITSNYLLYDEEFLDEVFGKAHEYFDIVVSDPRGVGLNHPVKCDPNFFDAKVNYFPRDQEEYEGVLEMYRELAEDCVERTGNIVHHMDTRTQAQDLEAIRLAIGEGPLNYYGVSWGSIRGAHYADLYPDNIRAVILDGVVDHSVSTLAITASQAQSYSLTQRRMLKWLGNSPDSVLHGRDAVGLWLDLVEQADQSPIPAPDCVGTDACFPDVTGNDLRASAFKYANNRVLWPSFAVYVKEAHDNGNASSLSTLKAADDIGSPGSQFGIACQDWDWKPTAEWSEYQKLQYVSGAMSLDTQSTIGARNWGLACPGWPTEVTNPPRQLHVKNPESAPILLVHALWDPATPYEAALGVHRQIDHSVLLTRYGEGHGSWEDDATFEIMFDYLAHLNLPEGDSPIVGQPTSSVEWDFERMGWDRK